ncbi:hypothetical protein LH464_17545 [Neorhizobium sp. T786]|uniref:hypothetical protein n=1 Tax=Pseudorhizobium xiangyangii TaxID=2883104 RepID=UPI001CFFCC44|nr:hypothetical protein [Neorhizobium xiangyangii]MCB5204274.1 hypothetical protein [Neorhizobium xiangyangii]
MAQKPSPDGHGDEAAAAEDDGFVAKITGKVNSMLFGETADEVPAGTEPLIPADEALPEHSQTKAASPSHPAEVEEHTAVVEIPDEKPAVKKAKASPAPVAAEDDDPEKHRRKPTEHAAAH